MGFLELPETVPEERVLRMLALRIGIDDGLGLGTGKLHQLAVSGYIRYFQVEGHSALLGALQVARTTELQVAPPFPPTCVSTASSIS